MRNPDQGGRVRIGRWRRIDLGILYVRERKRWGLGCGGAAGGEHETSGGALGIEEGEMYVVWTLER